MRRCENCEKYKDGRCANYRCIWEHLAYIGFLNEPEAEHFACGYAEYCKYYESIREAEQEMRKFMKSQ